jgi:hypothetical protein
MIKIAFVFIGLGIIAYGAIAVLTQSIRFSLTFGDSDDTNGDDNGQVVTGLPAVLLGIGVIFFGLHIINEVL